MNRPMAISAVPAVSRNWWLYLVVGLVAMVAGVLATVLFALSLPARGAFMVLSAFRLRGAVRDEGPGAAVPA